MQDAETAIVRRVVGSASGCSVRENTAHFSEIRGGGKGTGCLGKGKRFSQPT